MLITTPTELAERKRVIAASPTLLGLQKRLRDLLDPLLQNPSYVSPGKAMLSQDGGICPVHGARLVFNPLQPDQHFCPADPTGKEWYGRERDYLYWLMWYHIWLAERAIHLALLAALTGEATLAQRARDILQAYADQYRGYPNRDNVLGPTRLFFSTYLESIWLTEICVAADLLGGGIAEDMIAESAALISSYDENWSNRQVWSNTAVIAAGQLLKVPSLVKHGLEGPHGVRAMLDPANGKVSDAGFWYEGENYHFFALRGLQFAAELLRTGGVDLYADKKTGPVLGNMYVAPLLSVYPDLTLPARSDAPFGVSIRQPRFAELWEVGLARTMDPRLAAVLATLYDPSVPPGPDYGLFELSEQEQNREPARLSRELLGWKALLWMDPADPAPGAWEDGSELLKDQGLVVLRNAGRYLSLECGGDHGGHGHPDFLHVSLYWDQHWLVDPGTGSYVRPSLFWYRSTLAHNAPGLVDVGQESRNGGCTAFDSQGGWAWCQASAHDLFGPNCNAQRSLFLGPDYVLDVLDLDSPAPVDLPIHPFDTFDLPSGANPQSDPQGLAPAGIDSQTGYDALTGVNRLTGPVLRLTVHCGGAQLTITLAPREGEQLYTAAAWGPADLHFAETGPKAFLVRRATGPGRWAQAYATTPNAVTAVEVKPDGVHVTRGDGSTDLVTASLGAATVRGTGSPILLGGSLTPPSPPPAPPVKQPTILCPLLPGLPPIDAWETNVPSDAIHVLGRDQYRPSEEPYDSGEFSARVGIFAAGQMLCFAVTVITPYRMFRGKAEPNPELDNNPPDVNSDGVQCYLAEGQDKPWQGFLLVPTWDGNSVRVMTSNGVPVTSNQPTASWIRDAGGYRMLIRYDIGRRVVAGDRFPVNLIVNRITRGRMRRAGQLVLSRAPGARLFVFGRDATDSQDNAALAEVR